MTELSPSDAAKDAAARAAVRLVGDGMRVGLGTGSTAAFMVRRLAERCSYSADGRGICVEFCWSSQAAPTHCWR